MVDIKINDNFRVISTFNGYQLLERNIIGNNNKGKKPKEDNIGKESWIPCGYYSSIEGLVYGIRQKIANKSLGKDFEELDKDIKKCLEVERTLGGIYGS